MGRQKLMRRENRLFFFVFFLRVLVFVSFRCVDKDAFVVLEENDGRCRTPAGQSGQCTEIDNCAYLKSMSVADQDRFFDYIQNYPCSNNFLVRRRRRRTIAPFSPVDFVLQLFNGRFPTPGVLSFGCDAGGADGAENRSFADLAGRVRHRLPVRRARRRRQRSHQR